MHSKTTIFAAVMMAVGLSFASVTVKAQEIIEDGTVIVVEDGVVAEDGDAAVVEAADAPVAVEEGVAVVEPAAPATRVYGWTGRGGDCGTFHYWNGTRCIDARVEPPRPD